MSAFKDLRFKDAIQIPLPEDASGLERYCSARARIVLGDYAGARENLPADPARELLEIQLEVFTGSRAPRHVERLQNWIAREASSAGDFLVGEARFTLGYVLGALSRYNAALVEFSSAIRFYARAGFHGQAAMARFNYCLCAHHQGLDVERDAELERFGQEAESLARDKGNAVLLAFRDRFLGYRAFEKNALADAERLFGSARAGFVALDRQRDAGEMLSFEMIVALKSQRLNRFFELRDDFSLLGLESPVLARRLEILAELAQLSLPTIREARQLLRRAKADATDGITIVAVADLLLASLLRARAYEDVVLLYRESAALPKEHQQAPWLIDYRPYLAEALKHLGRKADSDLMEHSLKVQRDRSSLVEIDLARGKIRYKDSEKSVSSHPMIARMLECLHARPDGLGYEELFQKIYSVSYNPVLHQARYHSLIARTRRFLPSGMLIWSDGTIRFNPEHPVHLIARGRSSERSRDRRHSRQSRLIKRIARGTEFSLKELTQTWLRSGHAVSVRTLQYDLRELAKRGKILRFGQGATTRYRLAEA